MKPALLEEAILDRKAKTGDYPRAIILVHLYGMPAKLNEILTIANRYAIPVIEDAADALGSLYYGRHVGTFGALGVYSFNGNKIITTSGGGALVSANEGWIKKAVFLATQSRDAAPHYEHSEIGYNYRLSNVCAGIGRGQLQVLQERVQQRRAVYEYYKRELAAMPVKFVNEPEGSYSNRWLSTVLVETIQQRERIRLALKKENIESRPLWKPMHLQPVFKQYPAYTNGLSERLFETGLCLPSGSNLSLQDLKRVVKLIMDTF
jgi:dTDP-4-amino-4,6-dideoxygalactose transaminase